MKPTALGIQTQGDLGGEKILTRFDENSLEFIMSVLTDLYSDPELAVIREYSTNALDSHIEAGINRPIEVVTPTIMDPYLKIKDYGVGMSLDDIRQTYSAYGASTKRDTDEAVGMLGLGSKSAWTYTAQFTIVAVKGGLKTTVSANRTETGRTMLEVVDTCATDEPNGVEVIVPAKNPNTFEMKAKRFYRFWAPGTVLLNGEEPERISGNPLGQRMLICDDLDQDYVVMGNVAYPVTGGIHGNPGFRAWGIVARVAIGEVSFTPSREDLYLNSHTKAAIQALRDEFRDAIRTTIDTDINAAASHSEALTRWQKWMSRYSDIAAQITYKGAKPETQWTLPKDEHFSTWRTDWSRRSMDNYTRNVSLESLEKALCIVNYPSDSVSSTHRAKVRLWADETQDDTYNLPSRVYFFSTPNLPGSPWTDGITTVDWATIKAVKPPKDANGVRRSTNGLRFKVVDSALWQNGTEHGTWRETDELDTSLEILYFSPADSSQNDVCSTFYALKDEVQVVVLTKNRWDKFRRDFPEAKPLWDWVRVQCDEAAKDLSDIDRKGIYLAESGYYERNRLSRYNPDRILDQELASYIRLAKAKNEDRSPERKEFDRWARFYSAVRGRYPSQGVSLDVPWDRYPMLDQSSYGRPDDHTYEYMNWVYKQTQAEALNEIIRDAAEAMAGFMEPEEIPAEILDEESAA